MKEYKYKLVQLESRCYMVPEHLYTEEAQKAVAKINAARSSLQFSSISRNFEADVFFSFGEHNALESMLGSSDVYIL
jgi:hypothetical protein